MRAVLFSLFLSLSVSLAEITFSNAQHSPRIARVKTADTHAQDVLRASSLQTRRSPLNRRAESSRRSASGPHTASTNHSHPHSPHNHHPKPPSQNCFPALGFDMPSDVPDSLDDWWCNPDDEYAFMGFSYEVSACQSKSKLTKEFKDIRNTFDGRYVRIYGACDRDGFNDDVVDAAWEAGIGVQALIWFGFDGGDEWKSRRNKLVESLHSNPKAKFFTRGIQFGSEPLFDGVMSASKLAKQIRKLKADVKDIGVNVTVSDLAYGFQTAGDDVDDVFDAIDFVDVHMLPYFSSKASTGNKAWPLVSDDQDYIDKHSQGKKTYWSENGWPSEHDCPGVCPNSPDAVSNVKNEKEYFDTLDNHCSYFKKNNIGWFAHIYSDEQEPGYGIYDTNHKRKFKFHPKTEC